MIYLDRDTQQELVARLGRKLTPDGYLIAGCSESLSSIQHGMIPHGFSIYQKQDRPLHVRGYRHSKALSFTIRSWRL
jgi:chemotaxis methyl-accepting protein methylase